MKNQTETEVKAERSAKRFYTALVLLLFVIQASILGTALTLAIGDPALAVVPDYHQAALDWDSSHAASTAAAKMGWELQVDVSDVADGNGMRAMQLHALDEHGEPVSDLEVLGKVYHHAAADRVGRFEMKSLGGGRYLAMPEMRRSGLWQIELDVRNAGTPMSVTKTVDFNG